MELYRAVVYILVISCLVSFMMLLQNVYSVLDSEYTQENVFDEVKKIVKNSNEIRNSSSIQATDFNSSKLYNVVQFNLLNQETITECPCYIYDFDNSQKFLKEEIHKFSKYLNETLFQFVDHSHPNLPIHLLTDSNYRCQSMPYFVG